VINVLWEQIDESKSGEYKTFYARVKDGFLIKNVEKLNKNEEDEKITFFSTALPTSEWEFEEL
jgi:hypothetical protein